MRRLNFVSSKLDGHLAGRVQSSKFFFFLNSVLCLFPDYFSSCEVGQSVGGTKMGESGEKPPGTPASRTWLVSHMARAGLEPSKFVMKEILGIHEMIISVLQLLYLNNTCKTMVAFIFYESSRVMRKPDFSICQNKGADQLRINC